MNFHSLIELTSQIWSIRKYGRQKVWTAPTSAMCSTDPSQSEDEKDHSLLIASRQKKVPTKGFDLAAILGISAGVIMLLGIGALLFFVAIPEGEKKRIRDEMEHEASIKGPKVLEEILEELRLLRVAVENQR